ncbi:MAG TPA: TIGR03790 family protein [Verrucomicrobiae bacterium]|nr:TIGR03790 family protein [Verrucomicrobiae bacterium]
MRRSTTKNVRNACGLLALAGWVSTSFAAGPGDEVAVVYNSRLPESKELAFYYAERRGVPTNQVLGFDLPTTETISRKEFRDQLQKPLLKALEKQGLFRVSSEIIPVTRDRTGDVIQKLAAARVRYATLCYGVPVRILKDPDLSEPGVDKVREELRRNEASVDSELAILPLMWRNLPLYGPLNNPVYGITNATAIHPTNGVLMVARLDGPSPQIARGLVDKAMEAETNGLWGRAYFDVRGLTNSYKLGDDWIRGAADGVRLLGFETIVDEKPETFPAGFPMSQIGFYAGWYDGGVSGPFTRPNVEFMPGAVAYHLHSFSAHTIRAPDQYWVGPLLAKGATATMGCVDEPYLEGTPDVTAFFIRFTAFGFSFGEAAYAAQGTLSWQTTVVGDPLYRPFGRKNPGDHFGVRLRDLHSELVARKSRWIEWSHLQVVNLNLVNGFPVSEMIAYLEQEPATRSSAVLLEKLAEIYDSQGKLSDAIETYERALKQEASPQQRMRIMLTLARTLAIFTREQPALELYQRFVKEFPNYPDLQTVYQRMLPLAKELQKTADVEKIQEEIKRLQPAAAK